MGGVTEEIRESPFPTQCPDIRITESATLVGEIDCRELRWWFGIPQVGDRTMWANYDSVTRELVAVTHIETTMLASIHGVDGVEMRVTESSIYEDWPLWFTPGFFYSRLTDDETEWLAVIATREGRKIITTFRDEGFEDDWGTGGQRKLFDDGRYELLEDGSFRTTDGEGLGAGIFDVTVGGQSFCCLRILEPDLTVLEGGELVEAYVKRGGRTVLFRRYDGRYYRGGDLVQQYPNNKYLVIDGVEYVHCDCTGRAHDIITNTSLGR